MPLAPTHILSPSAPAESSEELRREQLLSLSHSLTLLSLSLSPLPLLAAEAHRSSWSVQQIQRVSHWMMRLLWTAALLRDAPAPSGARCSHTPGWISRRPFVPAAAPFAPRRSASCAGNEMSGMYLLSGDCKKKKKKNYIKQSGGEGAAPWDHVEERGRVPRCEPRRQEKTLRGSVLFYFSALSWIKDASVERRDGREVSASTTNWNSALE